MIPPKNDPRWKGLLEGKIPHQFKLLSAGMCVARNQRQLRHDPAALTAAVDEVHGFFVKYESLLAEDLPKIFN